MYFLRLHVPRQPNPSWTSVLLFSSVVQRHLPPPQTPPRLITMGTGSLLETSAWSQTLEPSLPQYTPNIFAFRIESWLSALQRRGDSRHTLSSPLYSSRHVFEDAKQIRSQMKKNIDCIWHKSTAHSPDHSAFQPYQLNHQDAGVVSYNFTRRRMIDVRLSRQ